MHLPFPKPVAITHMDALSPHGSGVEVLRKDTQQSPPSWTNEWISALMQTMPPKLKRHASRMSPAAIMTTLTLDALLKRTQLEDMSSMGYFLGVGASGGSIEQLETMLHESQTDGQFDTQRFGTDGLRACNPLFAFQLMNNFTLCHSAIHQTVGGPNAAIFSRGQGTVVAIMEAAWSILDGDAPMAITGGADCGVHPVTRAELRRDGIYVPSAQGVGLLLLTPNTSPIAWFEGVSIFQSDVNMGDVLKALPNTRHRLIADIDDTNSTKMPYTLAAHPALMMIMGALETQSHGDVDIITRGADRCVSVIHLRRADEVSP